MSPTTMIEDSARALARLAYDRAALYDGPFLRLHYPGGMPEYLEKNWKSYVESANAALSVLKDFFEELAGDIDECRSQGLPDFSSGVNSKWSDRVRDIRDTLS